VTSQRAEVQREFSNSATAISLWRGWLQARGKWNAIVARVSRTSIGVFRGFKNFLSKNQFRGIIVAQSFFGGVPR
jgi:hypothetical protein